MQALQVAYNTTAKKHKICYWMRWQAGQSPWWIRMFSNRLESYFKVLSKWAPRCRLTDIGHPLQMFEQPCLTWTPFLIKMLSSLHEHHEVPELGPLRLNGSHTRLANLGVSIMSHLVKPNRAAFWSTEDPLFICADTWLVINRSPWIY